MANREHRNPVVRAMGRHLQQYPWAHFLTLTFRPPPAKRAHDPIGGDPWGRFTPREHPEQPVAMGYALRTWGGYIREVQRRADAQLFWFYGVEYGERFGRLHIHALTGNTDRLPAYMMAHLWRGGWAHAQPYDPVRGASGYVAKYVTEKGLAEWDISDSPAQAVAFYRFRKSDAPEVTRLTRAAQARFAARERARRAAGLPPIVGEQFNLEGLEHVASSPPE